jgi:Uri superfamily endonuclease
MTDVWASRAPGTYLLLLRLDAPARLTIGRLGVVTLAAGWYVYVGSALGGLGARLRRHARLEKRHHWHVDTLRAACDLVAIAARIGPGRVECLTAARVAGLPGASLPVPRFGSSDCRCHSHLIAFAGRPDLEISPDWRLVEVDED